jgi:hypothetical protein
MTTRLYDADFIEITRDQDGKILSVTKVDEDALGIKILVDEKGNAPPLNSEIAFQQIIDGRPTGKLWSKYEMIRCPRPPR